MVAARGRGKGKKRRGRDGMGKEREAEEAGISTGEKFIARSTEFAGGAVIRAVNCPLIMGNV